MLAVRRAVEPRSRRTRCETFVHDATVTAQGLNVGVGDPAAFVGSQTEKHRRARALRWFLKLADHVLGFCQPARMSAIRVHRVPTTGDMRSTGHLVSCSRRYDLKLFSLSCVKEAGLKSRLFCCTRATTSPEIHRDQSRSISAMALLDCGLDLGDSTWERMMS
jgi:hypothetical protein